MELNITSDNNSSFATAIGLLGRAVREANDNKYAAAAREVVKLDLRFPQLTGPPVNGSGFKGGFIDILA